jgi:hypothetical protein
VDAIEPLKYLQLRVVKYPIKHELLSRARAALTTPPAELAVLPPQRPLP